MAAMWSFLKRPAAQPVEAIGNVLDALFTSDEERLDKQAMLARIAQQPALVQTEINRVEAAHKSVFVAGWRPFIGWVCGMALFYNFVLRDMLLWLAAFGHLKKSKAARNNPPLANFLGLSGEANSLLRVG